MEEKLFYQSIYYDNSEFKIWKKLDNGCCIGTLGYSMKNAEILMWLLKSFEEQYGEIIDFDAAKEELAIYQKRGKLFVYFNQDMKPISMNGTTYDEDNVSVSFKSQDNRTPKNIYFYGLSTLSGYRGHGACSELIKFAIDYAKYNDFDLVYARTDLINSNSEHIMQKAGLRICEIDNLIITEWVDVTDTKGDYRLHLWLPLKEGLSLEPKQDAYFTDPSTRAVMEKQAVGRIRKRF